jgi:GTP cyclohydrolase I
MLIDNVATNMESVFSQIYGSNFRCDGNLSETPERWARYLIDEVMRGCFQPPPKITLFNNSNYDQLINVGPIHLNSTCSHHLLPFTGSCFISLLPSKKGKLAGLSKYSRVVDWFAGRPQIQEELTEQIADFLQSTLKPRALAVRIVAQHMCSCVRGVKQQNMVMDTSSLRGMFRKGNLKNEFLSFCESMLK